MGYYTTFYLNINIKKEIKRDDRDKKIDEIKLFVSSLDDKYWELKQIFENGYLESKWYSYSSDMAYLSNKFKDIEFELDGFGEDREDIWNNSYINGELVGCKKSEIVDQFNNINKKRDSLLEYYNDILNNQPLLYYLNQILNLQKIDDDYVTKFLSLKVQLERWIKKYGQN